MISLEKRVNRPMDMVVMDSVSTLMISSRDLTMPSKHTTIDITSNIRKIISNSILVAMEMDTEPSSLTLMIYLMMLMMTSFILIHLVIRKQRHFLSDWTMMIQTFLILDITMTVFTM